ncbi:MAG: S9 family peptidase [Bacteroidales bacterium]|nr:S9 family peptidase [Bacteroidales bacterium]
MGLMLIILASTFLVTCKKSTYDYPRTKRVDTVDVYFNVKIADPYRWLEDDKSEETTEWVKKQNDLTFSYLESIHYRKKIKERLTELWNFPRQSTPLKRGGKYFFLKNDGLQDQDVLYMTTSFDSVPKVVIDPNLLSANGTIALMDYSVSNDGRWLAYAVARAGSDWREIFIKDLNTGENLEDHILWSKFTIIAWYKNGFFYGRYDEPLDGKELTNINLHHKIYYHRIGTSQVNDEIVFIPEVDKRICEAITTDDEKYLVIYELESSTGNSVSIKNLQNYNSGIMKLTTGFDYEYIFVGNVGDVLYFRTNYKAPNYRLVGINLNSLEIGNWQNILVPQGKVLEKCLIIGNKILACYLEDAKNTLKVYDLDGSNEMDIPLGEMGTVESIAGRIGDNECFYSFNTFINPISIYKYDMKTNTNTEIYKPDINFNSVDYITEQVFYYGKDSTKIPMFLVYKKGIVKDGNNPVWLYGYGGFNISMTPYYSTSRIIWLENGGVYALPNIRGGGEYGEKWHQAGTKLNKQNVFDDFIAAAEYLIDANYTRPQLIAASGGSNGGLLIGAVINQRPDLFKVAIPQVGVMDMLRFHKFTIGWAWTGDYGSSDDSIMFNYIRKYSPLHNISEEIQYPAILVTTADHDDRVVPAHSFKYIATLQKKYKGPNPVMIRVQTDAGHGGGTPTKAIIEEYTDILSFMFYNMNLTPVY